MTFLGKVLIVVQVVLSFCFMAFAGAVFAVHQNWRAKYDQSQQMVTTLQGELANLRDAHDSERDQLQALIDAANENSTNFQLTASAAQQQLAAANATIQNQEQVNARLEGEVEAAELEAAFRLEEAEEQRRENRAQQAALDTTQTALRAANDQIFALGVEVTDLQRRFLALQEENARHLAVLRQNGIDPSERLLGDVLAPPPPLDGRILDVQFDDAGRPRMVLISLGEDDGLAVGHVLDVYRVADDGETIYIGQVRVTGEPLPDRVVAEVLTENRNGIIEVADYVTTKL